MNTRGFIAEAGADTAGSALELSQTQEEGLGVIASQLAADLYGLEVVQVGIEDYKQNFTRFFVIGKGDALHPEGAKMKTSVVFAVIDQPGALMECLGPFGERNINLLKLESRPRRKVDAPGFNYVFYLDFEGHYA